MKIKDAIKEIRREGKRVYFPAFFSDFRTEEDAENARACVVEVLEQLTKRPLSNCPKSPPVRALILARGAGLGEAMAVIVIDFFRTI